LYRNRGGLAAGLFEEVLPALLLKHDASHGVQFVDFDGDGRLDLSLTNNDPSGSHPLLRNTTATASRGLSVTVTDAQGRLTRAGAEVRLFAAGSQRLIAAALVDSGSGYCSQNAAPTFLGVPAGTSLVDVEVTFPAGGERHLFREARVSSNARHLTIRAR
jgi:hypothetical protein